MNSLDILLDMPAIPRVLQCVLAEAGGRREEDLAENPSDRPYVQKAVEMLVAQGIITRHDGVISIARGEANDRRVESILRFYSGVDRAVKGSLLFRGILNAARYSCLVHLGALVGLMGEEGFNRQDVEALLAKDGREGYVERLTVAYRTREGLSYKSFPFIPLHHYPQYIMMKPDAQGRLQQRLKGAGVTIIEEEYLLGRYPKEIALQSREYLAREKEHLSDKIRDEGFDPWWYYRF